MLEPMARRARDAALLLVLLVAAAAPTRGEAALSAEMQKQLGESKYVYIQSQRKDGSFSKPAEIWFFVHDGSVYVASRKTTWRVRRLKAGHNEARIHVFKPDGPSFDAVGQAVADKAQWQLLFDAYAKKYTDGWTTFEKNFRQGSEDGSYVLIKYTPK